jgi:hypothetical protein
MVDFISGSSELERGDVVDLWCLESTLGVVFLHCVFSDFKTPNRSGGIGKAPRVKNPTFGISRTGNCGFKF